MMPLDLQVAGALVRPWRHGDEESLARHANNRKIWLNLRDGFPSPYTLEDAGRWILLAGPKEPPTDFTIALGDEAAGGIGFHPGEDVYRRSAEIGFWLGEAHWGKGIASAAVRAVTAHAFSAFDLCRLYAHVFAFNGASMRVLEKAGYACEAVLRKAATKGGKTVDVYLYAAVR